MRLKEDGMIERWSQDEDKGSPRVGAVRGYFPETERESGGQGIPWTPGKLTVLRCGCQFQGTCRAQCL